MKNDRQETDKLIKDKSHRKHLKKNNCRIFDSVLQVMEDGQLSVLNFSPAQSTMKQDEEEPEEEEEKELARIHAKHREHCPRLENG